MRTNYITECDPKAKKEPNHLSSTNEFIRFKRNLLKRSCKHALTECYKATLLHRHEPCQRRHTETTRLDMRWENFRQIISRVLKDNKVINKLAVISNSPMLSKLHIESIELTCQ